MIRAKQKTMTDILTQRQAAADAIAALKQSLEAAVPVCKSDYEAAAEEAKRAYVAHQAALRRQIDARRKLAGLSNRFDAAAAQHVKLLKKTADPAIAALRDEIDAAFPFKFTYADRNEAAAYARAEDAKRALDELALEPLTADELAQRLAYVRELVGLPALEGATDG